MLILCSQEVMCKKETIRVPITLGTSSKKSIFNFCAAVERPVCDRRPPALFCWTVAGWAWKSTSPEASRSAGRGKEAADCWVYGNIQKKEFSAICRQQMMMLFPPEAPQRSLLHFMLNSQMVQRAVFSHMLSRLRVTRLEHNLQLGVVETLWCVTFLLSQSLPIVGSGPTISKVM